MPTAQGFAETSRARRYLAQLCRHFTHEPDQVHITHDSNEYALADFGWGTCGMHAQPTGLVLRAEADEQNKLDRVQRVIGDHLEHFGRRDTLTIHWNEVTTG